MNNIKYDEIKGFTLPLLTIHARRERVTLACGYLDAMTYSELGEAAVIVRGVTTHEEMLRQRIACRRDISLAAQQAGVEVGMTGREALRTLGVPVP